MTLGKAEEENEVNVVVNAGDLMAFDLDEGASVASVNTSNSGLLGDGEVAFTGNVNVSEVIEVEGLSSNEEDDSDEEEQEYDDAMEEEKNTADPQF
jgi:hypothetical protein